MRGPGSSSLAVQWGALARRCVPAAAAFIAVCASAVHAGPLAASAATAPVADAVVALQLPFVPNTGHDDPRVAFTARTFAGSVFVTRDGEIVYSLPASAAQAGVPWSVVDRFVGGSPEPVGGEPAATRLTRFSVEGSAPSSGATYRDVQLGEVWTGIDVRLVRQHDNIEKVYTVAPGVDVAGIRMELAGAERLSIGPAGELVAMTGAGPVTYTAPIAFQQIEGSRRRVMVSYAVEGTHYGFRVGEYDASRPLVIDPFLQSTYVPAVTKSGPTQLQGVVDLAVHAATGDVYVLANLDNGVFPGTAGGAQPGSHPPSYDAVVARFDADLAVLRQATYYGAAGSDLGKAIAVSGHGVYVLGATSSSSLPGVGGGAVTNAGQGFVVRLSHSLTTILQATFLDNLSGAATLPFFHDLLAHSNGGVYVAGSTLSDTLRNTSGAFQATRTGSWDAFVVRFDAGLKTWIRATYLGGSLAEGFGDATITLAEQPGTGDVFVGGHTSSSADFPATTGGAIATGSGGGSGFVSRISADLATLVQSTYVYGRPASPICHCDNVLGLLVHPLNGDVYVAGDGSADLPAVSGSAQPEPINNTRAPYVARLNPALTAFVRTTYFGNESEQRLQSFAFGTRTRKPLGIHPFTGDVYLSGETRLQTLPGAAGGARSTMLGARDAFIVRFDSSLTQRRQATYAGGSGSIDVRTVLLVHPRSGEVYLGGATDSSDLPATSGGFVPTDPAAGTDGFILRVSSDLAATPAICSSFVDVAGASPFCPNVEWLRNRQVTLGCDSTHYCPDAAVIRLAMAAFMSRLGRALTPALRKREAAPGALALDAGSVVCQTDDHPTDGFPSHSYVEGVFMGFAGAAFEVGVDLVVSFDGGIGWSAFGSLAGRTTTAANRWENVRVLGSLDVWAGETLRFGLRATSTDSGASFLDSRCIVRARIGSRTATTSPFDVR